MTISTINIDETRPRAVSALTAEVRDNFSEIKTQFGEAATHVATITELRGINTRNGTVLVRGDSAAGDGAGGEYYWHSTSTDADDGKDVIIPNGYTDPGRWIRLYRNSIVKDTKAAVAALGMTQYHAGLKVFITSADGGAGTIRYDVGGGHSDDDATYCGNKFIINGDDTIYWERDEAGCHVRSFGANSTQTAAANSTAIQNAINYASNNGLMFVNFDAERYLFNNLYIHYDVTDNPGFSQTQQDQARIILKGQGRAEYNNLTNSVDRGTILESSSSTGSASIHCDGDNVVARAGYVFRIEDMSIEVTNTTMAVKINGSPQHSGMSNVLIRQKGAGGGVEHVDLYNCSYNNIRITGAGKATSLGKGLWIYNANTVGGLVTLNTIIVDDFADSVILGHTSRALGFRLHGILALNVSGGGANTGITIGAGVRSSVLYLHAENNTLGLKVINNAAEVTLKLTTSGNTKDAEFGSATADENYYINIDVIQSEFISTAAATLVQVYGGSTTENLTFYKPRFTGDGTTTAFAIEAVAHNNLKIIDPVYTSISTEIDNPDYVQEIVEDNSHIQKSQPAGTLTAIPFKEQQGSSTGAQPVKSYYQADIDKPFVEFESPLTPTTNYNHVSTIPGDGAVIGPKAKSAANGWAFYGMVLMQINTASGTQDIWVPAYTADAI